MLRDLLKRILRRGSQREDAASPVRLARNFLAARRYQDAIDTLSEVIAEDQTNAEALFLRGTAHLELQSVSEALGDLERALAVEPANPRCHYNIGVARWLMGDVKGCEAALQQALHLDPNFHLAHAFLSHIDLDGEVYLTLIERIHQHLAPRTYVEIGVFRGQSFALVRPETTALGIDPEPKIEYALRPNQRVFRETSDEFFARHDVRAELGGLPVDLGFIDGMHQFEYALRDFANLERLCAAGSTILVHDVFPLNRETAERERKTAFWSGDIWRLALLLRKHRPDLRIHTVGTPPTGLAVIRNLDPDSRFISDNLPGLIQEFLGVDFSVLEGKKRELLNFVPNRWEEIRALLDWRRTAAE